MNTVWYAEWCDKYVFLEISHNSAVTFPLQIYNNFRIKSISPYNYQQIQINTQVYDYKKISLGNVMQLHFPILERMTADTLI